jgi:hypothetical protein
MQPATSIPNPSKPILSVAMTSFDHLQQISFFPPLAVPICTTLDGRYVLFRINVIQHITNLLLLPPPPANARQHTGKKKFVSDKRGNKQLSKMEMEFHIDATLHLGCDGVGVSIF